VLDKPLVNHGEPGPAVPQPGEGNSFDSFYFSWNHEVIPTGDNQRTVSTELIGSQEICYPGTSIPEAKMKGLKVKTDQARLAFPPKKK
jgi:hypothetical protein